MIVPILRTISAATNVNHWKATTSITATTTTTRTLLRSNNEMSIRTKITASASTCMTVPYNTNIILQSDTQPLLRQVRTMSTVLLPLRNHSIPLWKLSSVINKTSQPLQIRQSSSLFTLPLLHHNNNNNNNFNTVPTTNAVQCICPLQNQHQQLQQQQQQQHRTFAAKAMNQPAKKKNDASSSNNNSTNEPTRTYWEQKKATKDRRREIYISRQERKQRVKVRRAGKPQDTKKIDFQTFYLQKKVTDEFLDRKSRQAKLSWKVRVAVLLERLHVVQPDKEKWEIEYEELKMHLNRFGKQYPKEFVGSDFDYDHERPTTYEELLAELPFTPAPRETEADASGDVRTTNRKLKTNIYLTVQEQDNGLWQFPTVDITDNETLLDAAKRAIPEQVGNEIEFWCPSNCPWSVHLTPYTEEEQKVQQLYGSKTFFMKVQYDEGNVVLNNQQKKGVKVVHDFAWLDRQEMVDRVKEQQGEHMSKFYYYML